jgi:hypothetical protein
VVADGGHGGDLGRACREEEERTRKERKERGERGTGGRGSYPLQAETAAASIPSQGSTTAAAPPSCLALREVEDEAVGWLGFGEGRKKESWAGNGPKQGKYIFFSQKYFLFSVSKDPLLFYKKGLQIQNYL